VSELIRDPGAGVIQGPELTLQEALAALSDIEMRFVSAYVDDPCATKAARRAGIGGAGGPRTGGCAVMARPNVRAAIDAWRTELAKQTDISFARWIKELAGLAYSDVTEYCFTPEGEPIKLEGEEYRWRAVQAIKRTTTTNRQGDTVTTVEIKLAPKTEAHRLIGRALGYIDGDGPPSESEPPVYIVNGDVNNFGAGAPAPG
jgi:phage terminase small subunit